MTLKKTEWGDIPNDIYVKDKDDLGKWIECTICHVKISIRSQFCFAEWETHCSGVRHCKVANSKALRHVPKIDPFFFFLKKKDPHLNRISMSNHQPKSTKLYPNVKK